MSRFERHIFVCTNRRADGHPKGCCGSKGADEVRSQLKAEIARRGLRGRFRANNSGCLDACEHGISAVVYPDGIWYGGITPDDVDEIIERTLKRGEVIERLQLPPVVRDKKR